MDCDLSLELGRNKDHATTCFCLGVAELIPIDGLVDANRAKLDVFPTQVEKLSRTEPDQNKQSKDQPISILQVLIECVL